MLTAKKVSVNLDGNPNRHTTNTTDSNTSMLSIKGGHVEVAPKRRSSYGGASGSSLASELANATSVGPAKLGGGSQQQVHERLTAASCLASSKRLDGNVRLLSIISLIVIAMLARQCNARAFLGMDSGNSNQFQGVSLENYNNAADRQQQQPEMSLASGATSASADVEYVIELGCRNLVESILNPQRISIQPKDQRAAFEFIEFMDNDRSKRLSPKHTPRFGR